MKFRQGLLILALIGMLSFAWVVGTILAAQLFQSASLSHPATLALRGSQSMKPQFSRSDSGANPDASTIRGGVLDSTGKSGAGETAEQHSRKTERTKKRRIFASRGGLRAAAQDAGSPGHQNQSFPRIYEVTAYSHFCTLPADGIEREPQPTASGVWPVAGRTVAADPSLPFGQELILMGRVWRVEDRGRAIRGKRIDIFLSSCKKALEFGRQLLPAYVVPSMSTLYADMEVMP